MRAGKPLKRAAGPTLQPTPAQRNQRLLRLLGANFVSGFAQGITWIAIPWYLVSTRGETDGRWLLTHIGAGVTLFTVVWGLYAGTLIDKYNRKHLFLGQNLFGAAVLAFAALYMRNGWGNEVPILILVSATTHGVFTLHYPNLYAFVQELFSPADYPRVNSGVEIQGQLTNVLGMTTGSVLLAGMEAETWNLLPFRLQVEPWPLWQIFALNALTYLVATLIIRSIAYRPLPDHGKSSQGPVWQRLQTGFSYLRAQPRLMVFGLVSYMVFFAAMISFQGIWPIYIREVLHGNGSLLGLAEAFFAAGALCAGLLNFWLLRRAGPAVSVRLIVIQLLGTVVLMAALAGLPSVGALLGGAALLGLMNTTTRINRLSFLLRQVPNHLIGRTNSFFQVANGLSRGGYLLLLGLPFFTGPGNGPNIRWGLVGLSLVLCVSALILGLWPPQVRSLPETQSAPLNAE